MPDAHIAVRAAPFLLSLPSPLQTPYLFPSCTKWFACFRGVCLCSSWLRHCTFAFSAPHLMFLPLRRHPLLPPPPPCLQVVAEIKVEFGYERAWCFRANTGFTALGLRKRQRGNAGSTPDGIGING